MTPEEARDALDALDPEPKWGSWAVKPGDRVTFDALGWRVFGVVTRCDDDGVTIEEVKHDAPPRPTLVDLTPEERAACKWMQCDVEGVTHERGVIIDPLWTGRTGRVIWPGGDTDSEAADRITPRPDLPRMGWPANRTTQAAADQAVAEGSVWGDAEELRRACVASNFDHITVTDKNGDAAQWFGKIAYWTPVGPRQHSAPFTVTHTGKRDEK